MKISTIKTNPSNPRLIKDDKFKKLCQSIKDLPKMMELRPIVVDENNIVQGGNMRLKALQELGYKEIPATWIKQAKDFTPDELKEFIIKDNVGFGEWDWDMLANEWDTEQLTEWGLDIPDFAINKEVTEDDYEIPDEIETDIVLGDLFEIGQHRLLCGDSTSADDVSKLLDGGKPNLMVTDPPYGVNYDPGWRKITEGSGFGAKIKAKGKVQNDDKVEWNEAYSLFTGNIAYVWHAGRHAEEVSRNLRDCGFEIICQIIWAKPSLTFSRGDYHWQHEPCWYAVKKGSKHYWAGDRKQTTLWEIAGINPAGRSQDTNDKVVGHGTQKPVECMARPIKNNTYERESVYDPFLGSGTTMVAAHQLNRKCYGMEIDPKYCQVIIDRMLKLDANIEIRKNGELLSKAA